VNYVNKETPIQVQIFLKQESIKKTSPIFAAAERGSLTSPAEMLKGLEALEILAEMPIPEAISCMLSHSASIPDKEHMRGIVDETKFIAKLMTGGAQEYIIEGRKES
jgi:hypothetical protein